MKLVIGTDEAGYGPNLGPLTITATGWMLEDHVDHEKLYSHFSSVFCRAGEKEDRIQVGDSKTMFRPSGGLGSLEHSVLALCLPGYQCHAAGVPVQLIDSSWSELLDYLLVQPRSDFVLPWYKKFNPGLPVEANAENLGRKTLQVKKWLEEPIAEYGATKQLPHFRQISDVIEPAEFNKGCEQHGNKASLLSAKTLQLAVNLSKLFLENSTLAERVSDVFVICDKHGGRNRYAGILQSFFPDCWVEVVEESGPYSQYRFDHHGRQFVFRFLAKGESQLPVAYASMISKYLREVSMKAFNSFWVARVKGLQPTAGYPLDARRFRTQVEGHITKLGLEESQWWRAR
ncbi:hypothetical protein OAF34_06095 [Pirellulaceae bacterium]|nr:hypothetical protein [Pirellulaceae bacterium]